MTFELVISDEAKAHLKLHRKSGQKLLLQKKLTESLTSFELHHLKESVIQNN